MGSVGEADAVTPGGLGRRARSGSRDFGALSRQRSGSLTSVDDDELWDADVATLVPSLLHGRPSGDLLPGSVRVGMACDGLKFVTSLLKDPTFLNGVVAFSDGGKRCGVRVCMGGMGAGGWAVRLAGTASLRCPSRLVCGGACGGTGAWMGACACVPLSTARCLREHESICWGR